MNERKEPHVTNHLLTAAGHVALLVSLAGCSSTSGTGATEGPEGGGSADAESAGDSAGVVDGESATEGGNPDDGSSPHEAGTTDGGRAGSPLAVNLGRAANYAVLAKSGISTVPTSTITGDLGLSPSAATYITGFSLTADSTNVFSTSPQVTGHVYALETTRRPPRRT